MADHVSDATLLERFVTRGEEAAFAALVQRHGPRVLGVCRRVLRNQHDAEDVFQATFLVLARKAVSVPWHDSVGGWLSAVAHRLALGARARSSRKRARERPVAALCGARPGCGPDRLPEEHHPQADPLAEIARRELRRVLDDELRQLPEKYRAPMVLCYLEGKTNDEAARELGWPTGSMSRRLKRGRALLEQRLVRRGLTLTTVLLCLLVVAVWWAVPRVGPGSGTVRQAMSPFGPTERGGQGLEDVLERLAHGGRPQPAPGEVALVAREAALAAERIHDHDPGKARDAWRLYTEDMRRSALQLAQAPRDDDGPATVAAARRLHASCLNCHAVFRQ